MAKPSKPVRSKEQLIAEQIMKKETNRQRTIVRDQLYPILLKNSTSVENAKLQLAVVLNGMQNAFKDKMIKFQQETSRAELGTINSDVKAQIAILSAGDKDKDISTDCVDELLALFAAEPLATVEVLLQGMMQEVDNSVKQENMSRKFDSLKLTLLN
jgi:hypothetical protein